MYDQVFPPCFEETTLYYPRTPPRALFILILSFYLVLFLIGFFPLVFPFFLHITPRSQRSLFISIIFPFSRSSFHRPITLLIPGVRCL